MNNKYRLKGWYLLLNIIIVLITLSSLAVLTGIIIFFLILIGGAFQDGLMRNVIALGMFSGALILFAGLMILLGIIIPLGNALFSYLQTESTGLELRVWPGYRLRCDWDQVLGVEHVRILGGLLSLPMLRFKEGKTESWFGHTGRPRPNRMPRLRGHGPTVSEDPSRLTLFLIAFLLWSVNDNHLIPLSIFNGWPNGKLRKDLESRFGPISFS